MSVNCRFRLAEGDVGPLLLADTASLAEVKQAILAAPWPGGRPAPDSAASLKLILAGLLLGQGEAGDAALLGSVLRAPRPGELITFHLVVPPPKESAKADTKLPAGKGSCCSLQ